MLHGKLSGGKSVFSVDGAQNTCGSVPGEAPCFFFTCRKDAVEAFALSECFQLEVSAMLNKRGWSKMLPPSQVTLLVLTPLQQQQPVVAFGTQVMFVTKPSKYPGTEAGVL